jgi:hypothetical protein
VFETKVVLILEREIRITVSSNNTRRSNNINKMPSSPLRNLKRVLSIRSKKSFVSSSRQSDDTRENVGAGNSKNKDKISRTTQQQQPQQRAVTDSKSKASSLLPLDLKQSASLANLSRLSPKKRTRNNVAPSGLAPLQEEQANGEAVAQNEKWGPSSSEGTDYAAFDDEPTPRAANNSLETKRNHRSSPFSSSHPTLERKDTPIVNEKINDPHATVSNRALPPAWAQTISYRTNVRSYSFREGLYDDSNSNVIANDNIIQSDSKRRRRYRFRGFSNSISHLMDDESVVCGAMSCFGLLLSCRTNHLLQQREEQLARKNHGMDAATATKASKNLNTFNKLLSLSLFMSIFIFVATFIASPPQQQSVQQVQTAIGGGGGGTRRMVQFRNHRPVSLTQTHSVPRRPHRAALLTTRDLTLFSLPWESLYLPDEAKFISFQSLEVEEEEVMEEQAQEQQENSYGDGEGDENGSNDNENNEEQNDESNDNANDNDKGGNYYYANGYNDYNQNNNNYYYNDNYYSSQQASSSSSRSAAQAIRLAAVGVFAIILGIYGTLRRRKIRYRLLQSRIDQDNAIMGVNHNVIVHALGDVVVEAPPYSFGAHMLCGCYPADPPYPSNTKDEEHVRRLERKTNDLTQNLFQCFSNACCGRIPCLGNRACCWYQCLGICALAQEAREIQSLVPSRDLQIDYLTHEPWANYTPRLRELRETMEGKKKKPKTFSIPRIVKQFKAMSKCAKYLWMGFALLTLVIVLALFCSQFHFGWSNFAVLIATFGQSFFVLYMVHRIYTKSYLSLDAISKFFAAGFLLAVPTAFVLELVLVNTLLITVFLIMHTIKTLGGGAFVAYVSNHSTGFLILYEFFNAFIVAAATEELCKYFVFRMVEHPDLFFMRKQTPEAVSGQLRRIVEGSSAGASSEEEDSAVADESLHLQGITHRKKAAAVTIAMLSVAVGLACAENVLYVFYLGGQNGGKASEEFLTLVMRSIFPIHAVCAAMQSINVVKKYVEYDPSRSPADTEIWKQRKRIGVGKSIFPAVVLHGCFDAVLMIVGIFATPAEEQDDGDQYYNNNQDQGEPPKWLSVFTWLAVIFITVVGLLWYLRQKFRQRKRLVKLDEVQGLAGRDDSQSFDEQVLGSKTYIHPEIV